MKSPTKWMLPAVLLLVVGTPGYSDEPEDTTKQILAEALATKQLVGRWHGRVVFNPKLREIYSVEEMKEIREIWGRLSMDIDFRRDGTVSFMSNSPEIEDKTQIEVTGKWKVAGVEGSNITVEFTDDKRKTPNWYGFTRVGKDRMTQEICCKTQDQIYLQFDRQKKKQIAPAGSKNKKP